MFICRNFKNKIFPFKKIFFQIYFKVIKLTNLLLSKNYDLVFETDPLIGFELVRTVLFIDQ